MSLCLGFLQSNATPKPSAQVRLCRISCCSEKEPNSGPDTAQRGVTTDQGSSQTASAVCASVASGLRGHISVPQFPLSEMALAVSG